MELVVLGPIGLQSEHCAKLKEMMKEHGIPDAGLAGRSQIWHTKTGGEVDFGCIHVDVNCLTVAGSDTETNVKRFLADAMKLAGVYTECTECSKRRYWKERAGEVQPATEFSNQRHDNY